MAKKKRRPGGGNRPSGHFCKVCGECKANEKFSGKGHAAHICKKCAALPITERNEMMAIRRIEGMAFRHLSEKEISWLRNHMNDQRPEVREAAIEAHRIKFPRYERNRAKKGMTALALELYIHDEIYDGWGGTIDAHARISAGSTGELHYTDYNAPEGMREKTIQIDAKDARRFLKTIVHEHNAPFWDEDLSDAAYEHNPFLDVLPEHWPDFDDDDDEDVEEDPITEITPDEEREPLWSLKLKLNTGETKEMAFYNNMHDEPVELFWALMEYFEPDEDGEESTTEA